VFGELPCKHGWRDVAAVREFLREVIQLKLVALLIAASGLLAGPSGVKATLTAPTHTPKINVRWPYTVRVTKDGKAVSARLTAQIVDPIGDAHPVQFGKGTKNITRWPFKGVFREYVIWPASSRGIPLTFRLTIVVSRTKKVINYRVTPHA
jgi:hypothetical protein